MPGVCEAGVCWGSLGNTGSLGALEVPFNQTIRCLVLWMIHGSFGIPDPTVDGMHKTL